MWVRIPSPALGPVDPHLNAVITPFYSRLRMDGAATGPLRFNNQQRGNAMKATCTCNIDPYTCKKHSR